MTRIAFTRATVFDSVSGRLRPNGTVVVEGERIVDVLFDATPVDDARIVDRRRVEQHVDDPLALHDDGSVRSQAPGDAVEHGGAGEGDAGHGDMRESGGRRRGYAAPRARATRHATKRTGPCAARRTARRSARGLSLIHI